MLRGEGNAGERWKTAIGLISKKNNFARAAHFFCTFLCCCFARLQRETCPSNKKMSPVFFLSLALNLCRPFFSLSFAGLPPTFSFSLSFSCSIFQICGHDNLSTLNNLDNTDTETISAFRFRLYWALVVSALQDAGGYAISRQNNLELHLGCHTCWLSYFALVCMWGGRTVGGRRSVG